MRFLWVLSPLVNAASSSSSSDCTDVIASHTQLGAVKLSLVGEHAWACSNPHWKSNLSKTTPQRPALGGSMAPTAGGGAGGTHTASLQTWSQLGLQRDLSVDTTDSQAGPVSAFLQKGDLRASRCLAATQATVSGLGGPLPAQDSLYHSDEIMQGGGSGRGPRGRSGITNILFLEV